MRVAGRPGILVLLLALMVTLEGSQVARPPLLQPVTREKRMAPYPRMFADFRRSSFQPITTQAAGRKVWFSPLADPAERESPQTVLVTATGLVVEYPHRLQKLEFSGAPLWSQAQVPGMEAVDDNGIVYFRSDPMSISGIDAKGKIVLSEAYVYTASESGWFLLVVPWEENRFLVETFVRRDEEIPSTGPDKHNLVLINGARWDDWAYHREFEGNALPGLLTGAREQVVIVDVGGLVNVLNTKDGATAARFRIEGSDFLQASLDAANTLITVCRRARGERVMAAYALQQPPTSDLAAPMWEVELPRGEDRPFAQPPATGLKNTVYYICANRLFCIQTGSIRWEFDVFPARNFQYCTVLGDNSTLIAAGHRLVHVDEAGEEIFTATIDPTDTITTPAVVDPSGRIYVGTPAGVYCFE